MPATAPRDLWQLRAAAGSPAAVVRVRDLQATVAGPDDAWGRGGRAQPALVSCAVELRRPFCGSSAADALAADTVHYGLLAKAVLASLARLARPLADAGSPPPRSLSELLALLFVDLTGFRPDGDGGPLDAAAPPTPFLRNLAAVRCVELTGRLPKASLVGDGPSFTYTAVFGDDDDDDAAAAAAAAAGVFPIMCGRTLRLRNLRVPTLIGINDNERQARQAVAVSVEVDNYEASRDIFSALEAAIVHRLEQSAFGTLEALVADLAETVTLYLREQRQEPVDGSGSRLAIVVDKPMAVPFADAPSVELRINTRDLAVSATRD